MASVLHIEALLFLCLWFFLPSLCLLLRLVRREGALLLLLCLTSSPAALSPCAFQSRAGSIVVYRLFLRFAWGFSCGLLQRTKSVIKMAARCPTGQHDVAYTHSIKTAINSDLIEISLI